MSLHRFSSSPALRLARALALPCSIALIACSSSSKKKTDESPTVPASQSPLGKTYAEWSVQWWQWLFGIEPGHDPMTDTTGELCGQDQAGSVWFLASAMGGTVERACTIPADRYVLFPLMGSVGILPDDNCPTLQCFSDLFAWGYADGVTLSAKLDGAAIPDLLSYRTRSGAFQTSLVAFGAPSDQLFDAIADGFFVMLKPLRPGSHELHFTAEAARLGPEADVPFHVDVTYHLTVTQ